ncbi:hypothetical protein QBC32DRAFT_362321 [Pseudoneurospora amorphoporcata]|uniref:Uncharacterized protein n=1 Tax=Pseudoneurospora amorphoporcata TaxID=241081 RepID=A0AAN6SG75_9PEZI|nr:hypothetical protein QBC32DRAFT_362321 [Pseudoneurospora amorphoporcata]
MTSTRTNARRSGPRANYQPPTLCRQDAQVIYEPAHNQGHDASANRRFRVTLEMYNAVNNAARNGRRLEAVPQGPQLPAYTRHISANETTMEMSSSEALPSYTEAISNEE